MTSVLRQRAASVLRLSVLRQRTGKLEGGPTGRVLRLVWSACPSKPPRRRCASAYCGA